MKKILLLLLFATVTFVSKANTNTLPVSFGDDTCKLSLAGKRNGDILLSVLKKQTELTYADTANCDYRLKEVEFMIKDKMGIDIISQTTPVFLDDMKKAIAKMEKGTKITITAIIWTDKKHTGYITQVMKFEVK